MTDHVSAETSIRFASLTALHAAHAELLKRRHEHQADPGFVAEIEGFIRRGRATGVVVDADRDRWAAQSVLDYWVTVLDRASRHVPEATLAEFDPSLAPELPDDLCPYLGLDAFQLRHHDKFFGRDGLVERLLEDVRDRRLVAVVGPSGSGKSSLVSAGLLPRLQAGALPESAAWRLLPPIVPGADPLDSLVQLVQAAGTGAAAFRGHPQRLAQLFAERGTAPAVVVVDQFEELFTLCTDEDARADFVDNLLVLTRTAEPRHRVILTLRSDFESHLAKLPTLQRVFDRAAIRITPLSAGELREAIEKPAAHVGLKFEQGLVDLLLHDILGEPAALPLLQFTLLKLWENRQRNRVTLDAYRRLGGGRLALARSADAFWEGLIPEEQVTTKRILLQLVRPGEGLEVTSRRLPRTSLHRAGEASDRIDRVLDKLIQARLLRLTAAGTAAEDRVEVAHEALIRNWPKLVDWLEDERGRLRRRIQLTTAAQRWDSRGRERAVLWRGSMLDEAAQEEDLDAVEAAFVSAGFAQQRRRRRVRALALAAGISLLTLAATMSVLYALASKREARHEAAVTRRMRADSANLAAARDTAIRARRQAEQQASSSESRAVAAAARDNAETDPERSLLLALYGASKSRTRQAGDALRRALQVSWVQVTLTKHRARLQSVAFTPDGSLVATAGDDAAVRLWDAFSGRFVRSITDSATILDVVFSPDGGQLATASADGAVRVWEVASGRWRKTLTGHLDSVSRIAFSSDGGQLASASTDSTARVWNLVDGSVRIYRPWPYNRVTSVAFNTEGTRLLTGSADGRVRIWRVDSARVMRAFPSFVSQPHPVLDARFSPDGRRIATGDSTSTVTVWDTSSNAEPLFTLSGHRGTVRRIAFAPDGALLATAGDDRTVRVWSAINGEELFTIAGHRAPVTGLAFGPAGDRLATASEDSTARIWDLSFAEERPYFAHGGPIWGIAFNWDDSRLATASADSTVKVWSLAAGELLLTLPVPSGGARSVAFSRDGVHLVTTDSLGRVTLWDASSGRRVRTIFESATVWDVALSPDSTLLATAGEDSAVSIWNADLTARARTLCCHATPAVWSVAFRPDGRRAATAGGDSTVRVWDARSGRIVDTLRGHRTGVWRVAYSPNGRLLASADSNGTVWLWDGASGRPLRLIAAHGDGIWGLAFSPDGSQLATASFDRTAKLWDPGSGSLLQTLSYSTTEILGLAFSHDGRHVATGSRDGVLRLHAVQVEDLVSLGRARITRGLTSSECDQYLDARRCPPTVEEKLVAGRELAAAGQLDEAVGRFRDAAHQERGLRLDPALEPQRVQARYSLSHGRSLARVGDAPGAAAQFREAKRRDARLRLDPDREAKAMALAFLLADGRRLAEGGLVSRAADQFRRARQLDTASDIDPDREAKGIARTVFVRHGIQLAKDRRVSEAVAVFNRAFTIDSGGIGAESWNELCWWGSLANQATLVLPSCERAVRTDSLATYIRDSRGLARALVNDVDGAVEDFSLFVDDTSKGWRLVEQRRGWIEALRTGRNPFKQRVLDSLRDEQDNPNLRLPYYDDFESTESTARNITMQTNRCTFGFAEGGFAIRALTSNYTCDWRVTGGEVPPRARIELTARWRAGPSTAAYGIRFGNDRSRASYFIAMISVNGNAKITFFDGTEWTDMTDWEPVAAIHTSIGAPNTLAVEVRASSIEFYVNGALAQSYTADRLVGGYVGIHNEGSEADVLFDDVRVLPLMVPPPKTKVFSTPR